MPKCKGKKVAKAVATPTKDRSPDDNVLVMLDERVGEGDPDEENISPATKKSRTDRRDLDVQVSRIAERDLLPRFGTDVFGLVSKSGESVRKYMLRILASLQADGKYWTPKHTDGLYKTFGLGESVEDRLEDHGGSEEDVRPLLKAALALARSLDPALKSADSLERLLDDSNDLTKCELYLCFAATQEGPRVSKRVHSRCYTALGKYLARTLK